MKFFVQLVLLVALSACGTQTPFTSTVSSTLAPEPTLRMESTTVPLAQNTITPDAPPSAALVTAIPNPTTLASAPTAPVGTANRRYTLKEFPVPPGSHPHDVAPAADGGIWYTAQNVGALGYLDVKTGATRHIPLGGGSAPHGVILGPDDAPWITDSGLNAIVRVDPATDNVAVYPLPADQPNANLNTAVFDHNGVLWFTGQRGVYGKLDPGVGIVQAWSAPRGRGPYGITVTPNGAIYYASLAGSHIARIDPQTHEATVIEPPTKGQGARRVWSDSFGNVWVSEWNAGQVGKYDPTADTWQEWKLPGAHPQAYAVYVDENDKVWLTDFGGNALVRFDPATETFDEYPFVVPGAAVRQLLGRPGEIWGAESGLDKIVVARATVE